MNPTFIWATPEKSSPLPPNPYIVHKIEFIYLRAGYAQSLNCQRLNFSGLSLVKVGYCESKYLSVAW